MVMKQVGWPTEAAWPKQWSGKGLSIYFITAGHQRLKANKTVCGAHKNHLMDYDDTTKCLANRREICLVFYH